jgi:hypothetical protein
MNIIIGLLITILILVLIFIVENFSTFRVVYTTKHINKYFAETNFMNEMLSSIERRDSLEWLTPVSEKKLIEELEEEIDSFTKTCNRLFLDKTVLSMYLHKYKTEISNAFARKLKSLA